MYFMIKNPFQHDIMSHFWNFLHLLLDVCLNASEQDRFCKTMDLFFR